MCVTAVELWNTSWLRAHRCGHRDPFSPCTLEVHAVDRRTAAVDHEGAENLADQLWMPVFWLPVFSRICFISSYMRKMTMNASSTTR